MRHDLIIVGSGASAVGAALGACEGGLRPLLIDVGLEADEDTPRPSGNLYDFGRHHDRFDLLIGERLDGLSNLLGRAAVPAKLTAPAFRWVTRDAGGDALIERDFSAVRSYAKGGLANAWGAGLYRFTADELGAFPFPPSDLGPAYDRLTAEIGIAGCDDDLRDAFGTTQGLLEPLELSRNVADLYRRYRNRRRGHARIRLGRARIAVLPQARGDRPGYDHSASEFFVENRAIYSPRFTLERLIAAGSIDYRPDQLVESFAESADGIEVRCRSPSDGVRATYRCRRLVLAAGAINTTRIVLASAGDHGTVLPLLENPALQVPLLLPHAIGRRLDTRAFGLAQLNIVWDSETFGERLQASIMESTGPARAELVAALPLSARANLVLLRHLLPAMLVMQVFLPGSAQPAAAVSLERGGRLRIVGQPNRIELGRAAPLWRFMRGLGAFTHPALVVRVPTGHAIHYAGSMPMRRAPRRYECDAGGRLEGTRGVYVADSAALSALPAKNMSFTMMANALRVGAGLALAEAP